MHRIVAVGEARHHAGALVDEGQRLGIVHPLECRRGIGAGLFLHRGDLVPPLFPLRFDHADGPTVDEQHIVRRTYVGRILAHRDPDSGAEVDLPHRLHTPSRLLELGVDGGARPLLGSAVVVSHCCIVVSSRDHRLGAYRLCGFANPVDDAVGESYHMGWPDRQWWSCSRVRMA